MDFKPENCTGCAEQINTSSSHHCKKHPDLNVLLCRSCYKYCHSGAITKDKSGIDEQCFWCREGGQLIVCDFCPHAFCKKCIKRNIGRTELTTIINSDDDHKWKCYVCDSKKLQELVKKCKLVFRQLKPPEKSEPTPKPKPLNTDSKFTFDIKKVKFGTNIDCDTITEVLDQAVQDGYAYVRKLTKLQEQYSQISKKSRPAGVTLKEDFIKKTCKYINGYIHHSAQLIGYDTVKDKSICNGTLNESDAKMKDSVNKNRTDNTLKQDVISSHKSSKTSQVNKNAAQKSSLDEKAIGNSSKGKGIGKQSKIDTKEDDEQDDVAAKNEDAQLELKNELSAHNAIDTEEDEAMECDTNCDDGNNMDSEDSTRSKEGCNLIEATKDQISDMPTTEKLILDQRVRECKVMLTAANLSTKVSSLLADCDSFINKSKNENSDSETVTQGDKNVDSGCDEDNANCAGDNTEKEHTNAKSQKLEIKKDSKDINEISSELLSMSERPKRACQKKKDTAIFGMEEDTERENKLVDGDVSLKNTGKLQESSDVHNSTKQKTGKIKSSEASTTASNNSGDKDMDSSGSLSKRPGRPRQKTAKAVTRHESPVSETDKGDDLTNEESPEDRDDIDCLDENCGLMSPTRQTTEKNPKTENKTKVCSNADDNDSDNDTATSKRLRRLHQKTTDTETIHETPTFKKKDGKKEQSAENSDNDEDFNEENTEGPNSPEHKTGKKQSRDTNVKVSKNQDDKDLGSGSTTSKRPRRLCQKTLETESSSETSVIKNDKSEHRKIEESTDDSDNAKSSDERNTCIKSPEKTPIKKNHKTTSSDTELTNDKESEEVSLVDNSTKQKFSKKENPETNVKVQNSNDKNSDNKSTISKRPKRLCQKTSDSETTNDTQIMINDKNKDRKIEEGAEDSDDVERSDEENTDLNSPKKSSSNDTELIENNTEQSEELSIVQNTPKKKIGKKTTPDTNAKVSNNHDEKGSNSKLPVSKRLRRFCQATSDSVIKNDKNKDGKIDEFAPDSDNVECSDEEITFSPSYRKRLMEKNEEIASTNDNENTEKISHVDNLTKQKNNKNKNPETNSKVSKNTGEDSDTNSSESKRPRGLRQKTMEAENDQSEDAKIEESDKDDIDCLNEANASSEDTKKRLDRNRKTENNNSELDNDTSKRPTRASKKPQDGGVTNNTEVVNKADDSENTKKEAVEDEGCSKVPVDATDSDLIKNTENNFEAKINDSENDDNIKKAFDKEVIESPKKLHKSRQKEKSDKKDKKAKKEAVKKDMEEISSSSGSDDFLNDGSTSKCQRKGAPRKKSQKSTKIKPVTNVSDSEKSSGHNSDIEKDIKSLTKDLKIPLKTKDVKKNAIVKEELSETDEKPSTKRKAKDNQKSKTSLNKHVIDLSSDEDNSSEENNENANDNEDDSDECEISESEKTALGNTLKKDADDDEDVDDKSDGVIQLSSSDSSDSDTFQAKKKVVSKRKAKKTDKKEKGKDSDDDESSDESSKKTKVKKNKKLLDAKISSDSSDDSEDNKKKRKKKSNSDSDDSDDFQPSKKIKGRGKKRKKNSDSSAAESWSGLGTTDDEDEDGQKKKKKKKRKRIKNISDSDDENDEKKASEGDDEDSPDKGKRKAIRKVMSSKKLGEESKAAAKAEQERRKRVEELQKKFNVVTEKDASSPTKCPKTTQLILESDKDGNPLVEVNKKLIPKLKPHQVEAVQFMWSCLVETVERREKEDGSGCILAHCMGLGKTLSVITLVHTLLTHDILKFKTCLIVAPLNTVINWQNEWEKWLDPVDQLEVTELSSIKNNPDRLYSLKKWQKYGGILIMGYQMFRTLCVGARIKKKKMKEEFAQCLLDPGPDLVVCDEGHILKNDASGISKVMTQLKTKRRVVLTGTPLQNNLVEYHCMVNFVKENLLGTRPEFSNRFVNPITNGQHSDSTGFDVKLMKRRAHILHDLLNGCVQRRDYSALTKFLPQKYEYVIAVRLSEKQMKLYETYLDSYGLNKESEATGRGKGSKLFTDYHALSRVWTHPWVLKMDEVKKINRGDYDKSDSEDSFINDDVSEEESSTSMSSNSDSDSDKAKKPAPKAGSSKRMTRNSRQNDDDDVEIINEWKTASRSKEEVGESSKSTGATDSVSAMNSWWDAHLTDEDEHNINVGGKIKLLFAILRMCEEIGDKVLVFTQSLLSLDLIEHFLHSVEAQSSQEQSEKSEEDKMMDYGKTWIHGSDYFRMDGSTQVQFRSKWSDIFNDKDNYRARLFLISTKAGSLGINLVAANRVIMFDASWNPSHDIQSIFRVYRFGQLKPCYVYRFLAQGTMEEKIYERQVTKQSLSQRVVDEHQIDRHFSSSDLQELYNFKPERLDDPERANKPTPKLPQDHLLAELLKNDGDWIVSYHEHDSLLENKVDQELDEEERKAAWEDYENEKKGIRKNIQYNMPPGMSGLMDPARQQRFGQPPMPGFGGHEDYQEVLRMISQMRMMNPHLSPAAIQELGRQVIRQRMIQQHQEQQKKIEMQLFMQQQRQMQNRMKMQRQQQTLQEIRVVPPAPNTSTNNQYIVEDLT